MTEKLKLFFYSLALIPIYFIAPIYLDSPSNETIKEGTNFYNEGILFRAHQLIHDWHFYLLLSLIVATFFAWSELMLSYGFKLNRLGLVVAMVLTVVLLIAAVAFPIP